MANMTMENMGRGTEGAWKKKLQGDPFSAREWRA